MVALRVLRAVTPPAAHHAAHDHRHGLLAAEHRRPLRGMVDDLVHREQQEVHAVMHEQGAHAHRRGADAHAGEGVFRQGALHHPLGAVLLERATEGAPHGARIDDADADQEHARIAVHGQQRRVAHRLAELHLHRAASWKSAVGHGAERACSKARSMRAAISASISFASPSLTRRRPDASGSRARQALSSSAVR